MSQWISVKDRLPEQGKNVLVFALSPAIKTKEIVIDRLEDGENKLVWMYTHGWYTVTHWMPLPEPPNKIEENKTCNANYFPLTTRADRIRSMSDEQMARGLIDMIADLCEDGVPCYDLALEWFRKPVEGD